MLISKATVDRMQREVVANKVAEWTRLFPFLDGKFDVYGRAKIGTISTLNSNTVNDEIRNKCFDYYFKESFNEYLSTNKLQIKNYYEMFSDYIGYPSDIAPEAYIKNSLELKDEKGKVTHIKASRVFAKVQEIWLTKNTLYVEICNELKQLRASGLNFTDYDVQRLTEDKKRLEDGNLFVIYENFMNSTRGGNELWISVNPLDKLTSSGGSGYGLNPTGFTSCWSNHIETYSEKSIRVQPANCYANPEGNVAVGSIINNCLIYIPNGKNCDIPETEFKLIGYKERSHAWYDIMNGQPKLYVEKMYPTKDEYRKQEIMEVLKGVGFGLIKDGDYEELQRFTVQDIEGIKNYIDAVCNGSSLFFDRVAIDREGDLSLRYLVKDRLNYNYDSGDGFPESEYDWYCDECGEGHYDDDDCIWVGGRRMCMSCADNYYYCEHCGEYHTEEDDAYMNGTHYCRDCAERIGFYCEDCGEWYLNRRHDSYEVIDRWGSTRTVCESCLESNYTQCDECGEYHDNRNMNHVDAQDVDMCENCYDELVVECPHCGETFDRRESYDFKDGIVTQMYCSEDCRNEATEELMAERRKKGSELLDCVNW